MTLSRKELFDEMGLAPLWVLRESASVERGRGAVAQTTAAQPPVPPVSPSVSEGAVEAGAKVDVGAMDWVGLRQAIMSCRACGLCSARKQAVPGVGDEQADWLFIGEGPGAEEDARGEPFVGQAGRLLDAMLMAIDLQRGNKVYIANAVKCRPPGNRTPEAGEIAACWPYLQRQIALLRPKVIVLLGKVAVSAVLREEGALSGLRGKPVVYRDGELEIPVVVTYHPAYLLRNLPDKSKAWEDLCRARQLMRRVSATA